MKAKKVWPSTKPTPIEKAEAGVKFSSLASQHKMPLLVTGNSWCLLMNQFKCWVGHDHSVCLLFIFNLMMRSGLHSSQAGWEPIALLGTSVGRTKCGTWA